MVADSPFKAQTFLLVVAEELIKNKSEEFKFLLKATPTP